MNLEDRIHELEVDNRTLTETVSKAIVVNARQHKLLEETLKHLRFVRTVEERENLAKQIKEVL